MFQIDAACGATEALRELLDLDVRTVHLEDLEEVQKSGGTNESWGVTGESEERRVPSTFSYPTPLISRTIA